MPQRSAGFHFPVFSGNNMEYELKGCVSGSHRPDTSTQSDEKSWESAKAVVPFCSWKAGNKLNSLEKIDRA